MPNRISVLWPFGIACFLLIVGYCLLIPASPLRAAPQATTLQVDRLDDPALPTASACTAAPNDCSLRGAVDAAADHDSIELGVIGTITLQSPITLNKHLTITSVSASDHVIDGADSHIIFAIEPHPFEDRIVILEGLTLQNGFNATGSGGAVTMQDAIVTLRDLILQENVATGQGGAINVAPTNFNATLYLDNVTFRNNRAFADKLSGGALYARALFMVPVQVFVTDSHFENNIGGSPGAGDGGAIVGDAIYPGANLDLDIRNTRFISNGSDYGGAVSLRTFAEEPGGSSSLDALFYNTTFINNQGTRGGALYVEAAGAQAQATLVISDSTFATNTATVDGGAIYNLSQKDLGALATVVKTTIHNSVFYNNQSVTGDGGALYNHAQALVDTSPLTATFDLRNVTLSGNHAGGHGGALYATSAGVTNTYSLVTATHVTAFDNSSGDSNDFYLDALTHTVNSLYLKNTLVDGSAGANCGNVGATIDGANNLIQDTSCGNGAPFRVGNPHSVIPTLTDNGGATFTHGLFAGSNALDAVPGGQCTVGNGAILVTRDQRGQARPFGATCDIGAFEATAPPPVPAITGLSASNDGPTQVGSPTTLQAAITGGVVEGYTWSFGDGQSGSGITTTHPYTQSGIYTATVVATNTTNAMTATTTVYVGDAVVEVFNNFYDPTPVTVPVGSKVVWVLRQGNHSVTDEGGAFEQPAGSSWPPFINTFNTAETYDYFCTVHGAGMRGQVIVGSGSAQPGVRLPTIYKADTEE